MKFYYADIAYKSGLTHRVTLSLDTWTIWGARLASQEDNPMAKGTVLVGLNAYKNPIVLRTKDVSSIELHDFEYQPNQNGLNDEDHYDNPLN